MKSGKYKYEDGAHKEVVHLDIDGTYNLNKISGTILHSEGDIHWVADLKEQESNFYSGVILFLEDHSNSFVCDRVEVDTSNDDSIELEFFHHDKCLNKKKYQFNSNFFRALKLEFDHECNVEPVRNIDTHAHADYPSGLDKEVLSITEVLGRAGIKVNELDDANEVGLDLSGDDRKWCDNELHDAMIDNFENMSDEPQWTLWVFNAGRYIRDDVSGVMFDTFGEHHRQGVAIFNNSTEFDTPIMERQPEEWARRLKFFTTCHEIGHGLNLVHPWDREVANLWFPERNEDRGYSFMSYPWHLGSIKSFFEKFRYRFSDSELMHLRHAPERFVEIGNAPWALHSHNAEASHSENLKLMLHTEIELFEYLEPVIVTGILINQSDETIEIPMGILKDRHHMTIEISKNDDNKRRLHSYSHLCSGLKKRKLQPKDPGGRDSFIEETFFVSADKYGWIIHDPGIYTIQARLEIGSTSIVSNKMSIQVKRPVLEDQSLAQDYFSDEVGRLLAFGGSKRLPSVKYLEDLVKRKPESRAAVHARIALAKPDTHVYKSYQHSSKKIEVKQPDRKSAKELLEKALSDPTQAVQTLGLINYKRQNRLLNKVNEQHSH